MIRFKDVANALRICVAYTLVLTAFSAVTYAAAAAPVPEIDAGMAGSAVALLVGGYLVFVSRARRK